MDYKKNRKVINKVNVLYEKIVKWYRVTTGTLLTTVFFGAHYLIVIVSDNYVEEISLAELFVIAPMLTVLQAFWVLFLIMVWQYFNDWNIEEK